MVEYARQIGNCLLHNGYAEEVLLRLPDASVQLIIVDPPYRNVKAEAWDRQWPTRDAYLGWLRQMAKEWQRILVQNGSLYCFASTDMASWVETTLSTEFHILNRIQWIKENGWHKKTRPDDLRSFLSPREEIIFAEHYGTDSMALGLSGYAAQCENLHGFVFEPLRKYLEDERKRAGISREEVNKACGVSSMAGRHYFTRSQWCLPTQEHYEAMQRLFNHGRDYEYLRRDYEYLRRDYEELRRPFYVSAKHSYVDIWYFNTVIPGSGKHLCEKPLPLLRHMIEISSKPGDMVLDCFFGSGSTLEAAQQCGRKAIGIEQDRRWWQRGCERLSQLDMFGMIG